MELTYIATRDGRLSSFLKGELQMSMGLMNKLKWGDAIQVNGQPQRTNYPVKPADVITVRLEEEEPEYPASVWQARFSQLFLKVVNAWCYNIRHSGKDGCPPF